ncbi:hypothetical protein [Nonomuraea sp. JJY05]|jgi:hypothetical protein|uniref:hypothetical protein n=1 Tax=Nonomuraea sp. JJY05 TaxID=3350255 RepID=UPI00373EEEF3
MSGSRRSSSPEWESRAWKRSPGSDAKATCAADRIPADQAEGGILDALPAGYEDGDLVVRAAEAAACANEGLSGQELPPGRPSPTGRRIDTAACRISLTVEAAIV